MPVYSVKGLQNRHLPVPNCITEWNSDKSLSNVAPRYKHRQLHRLLYAVIVFRPQPQRYLHADVVPIRLSARAHIVHSIGPG